MKQTQSKTQQQQNHQQLHKIFCISQNNINEWNKFSSIPLHSTPLHSMCKTTHKEIDRILLSVCGGHLTLVKSNSNGSKYLEHIHKWHIQVWC